MPITFTGTKVHILTGLLNKYCRYALTSKQCCAGPLVNAPDTSLSKKALGNMNRASVFWGPSGGLLNLKICNGDVITSSDPLKPELAHVAENAVH